MVPCCRNVSHFYVKPPQSTATIAAAERLYAALGLPGAISSTDCTHAQWDMCPASELVAHKGPKGKPTRVFQMTVGHNHIIYYVSRTFPGTYADKSIVRYDEFLQQVRRDPLYTQFPFKDLQFPVKRPWSMEALLWSARIESVRKDVECAFGRLKGRFRILKLPLRFHKIEV